MANPPIDRRPADPALASTIREISRSVRSLLADPTLTALQRTPVTLSFSGAATQRVAHGLGRPAKGYLVISNSTGAVVSDGTFVAGDDPSQVFYIHCAGAAVLKVLFI